MRIALEVVANPSSGIVGEMERKGEKANFKITSYNFKFITTSW